MKLIYIAGKYRDEFPFQIKANIDKAEQVGMDVARLDLDAYPVIPHCNTAHWEGLREAKWFIDGTLELSRKCDAVLVVPNFEDSVGTKGEIEDATRRGVPVFYDINKLKEWLTSTETEE